MLLLTIQIDFCCIQDIKMNLFLKNIALSQFRLSSHDLEIERGRYADVDRDARICHFCNNNQIENEYHFLLICPLYRGLRKLYMKHNYYQ